MNVLVPVDGSKHSRWALEWVAQLPLATPLRLTALHVVDLVSLRAPMAPHPVAVWDEAVRQAEARRLEARAKRIVAETKKRLTALGLTGRVVVERGAVAPAILKHGRKRGSLVVMGSRGLGALDRFLLGSVSTRVVHHASCPVLIVKQPARPLRRLLLATDGSRAAARAVEFVRDNLVALNRGPGGKSHNLEVVVMHVMPFLRYPELKTVGKALVEHADKRLAQGGFATERVAKLGSPADEIIAHAQGRNIDLVVTGARGLGAAARLLVGSVSTKLLHRCPCSVLVVR